MSTTPRTTKVDPCQAQRNAADRAQKAVNLTESKLEADPSTVEKRRLEKLLAQQTKTLANANRLLIVCERTHSKPGRKTKTAAKKKKSAKRK